MAVNLDLKRERELLTTPAKRMWDAAVVEIEAASRMKGFNQKQKELFFQQAMIEIRCADMMNVNNYLMRNPEESFSKRAIARNNLKIEEYAKKREEVLRAIGNTANSQMQQAIGVIRKNQNKRS